jgi:hypothetical protein
LSKEVERYCSCNEEKKAEVFRAKVHGLLLLMRGNVLEGDGGEGKEKGGGIQSPRASGTLAA